MPDTTPATHAAPVGFREITRERYDDMFSVLPPAGTHDAFLVSEPWNDRECRVTGHLRATYGAFFRAGDRFYEAVEPMTPLEFREFVAARVRASVFARAEGGAS